MRTKLTLLCLFLLTVPAAHQAQTQNVDTQALGEMRWRDVGPLRGGRTRANSGVPSQPNVFYVGAVNGGVWKTNDYGRTSACATASRSRKWPLIPAIPTASSSLSRGTLMALTPSVASTAPLTAARHSTRCS